MRGGVRKLPASFADDEVSRTSDWSHLAFLARYGLRARGLLLAALVLLPFVVLVPLLPPRLVRRAIDVNIALGDYRGLAGIAILYLLLSSLDLALKMLNNFVAASIGQRISLDLRRDLARKLFRLPFPYFRKHPMGRLMTRLTTDLENVNDAFAAGAVALVGDGIQILGIAGAMLLLDLRTGLAALSILPFLLLFTLYVRGRMRDYYRVVRGLHAEMNAFSAEVTAGASTIQALGAEARFERRFRRVNDDYFRTVVASNLYESAFYTGIHYFGTLSIAVCVGYAGAAAVGGVKAGLLTAMTQYIVLLFIPLRGVANKFATFQQAFTALERIARLMEEEEEPSAPAVALRTAAAGAAPATEAAPAAARAPRLRLEGVGHSYREGSPVLSDLSLEVAPGERLAVVGETGAGKSTLARLLLGLEPLRRGRITLDGVDLPEIPLPELRKRIGFVSQDSFLFEAGLAENLAMGREIAPERIEAVIRDFGLSEIAGRFGEAGAGEGGRRLSEGEKQLVALARLAAGDPGLVLLDEATSALDPEIERRVKAALDQVLAGRTAIVIAHRLSTLEDCDRVAVLHHGKLAEIGTHEELLAREGIYAKLWRLYRLEGRLAAAGGAAAAGE